MGINETLRDAAFKDNSPLDTVERIRAILADNGISVTEKWGESGVPYCHSLRVSVDGTGFGVNGKGLTKEFARASAYGEVMERLQFGFFGSRGMQKESVDTDREKVYVQVNAKEHVLQNKHWYEALNKKFYEFTGCEEDSQKLLDRYTDEEGNIKVFPYYNLTRNQRTYYPIGLHSLYTTNGAAAGNTLEEALVQAISETVERNHQLTIIREGISMPDVPEEVLKQCKTAYDIITFIRNNGFKVAIKDASLGTKFPVICAVFVDERTGRYHTHFGAYPIFEIALSRSITETFQGRNIENFAAFEEFHYDTVQSYSVMSLVEELVKGSAKKHIDFFVGPCKYPFNEQVGFRGSDNRELLRECIEYFQNIGHDILVRDRSCLGFHAYQVIIPGYSEWAFHRLTDNGDDVSGLVSAVQVLRYPVKASREEIEKACEYLKLRRQYGKLELRSGDIFRKTSQIPAQIPEALDAQLMNGTMAYLYYAAGDPEQAAFFVDRMIKQKAGKTVEYLTCFKRYLNMKQHGYSEEQIKEALTFFHKQATCERLFACIAENRNPMEEYTLRCDDTCTPACMLCGFCKQRKTLELLDMIQKKVSEMDFEDLVAKIERFHADARH